MSESWRLTLPCTRAEAEIMNGDVPALALLDPAPVILTEELVDFDETAWQLTAYFDSKPDKDAINCLKRLLPSSAGCTPVIEHLPAEDWVTLSQQGIEPVNAGRFHVHTASNRGQIPDGATAFQIEASRAFGTGSHETTVGCLQMLDSIAMAGKRFHHIADIGTGSGLLAFAARHLWMSAQITASDIDPVSIDVSRDNAGVNDIPLGRRRGEVALCVASGTDHALIQRRSPYDLVVANILAGPLIELAPAFNAILDEGGTLILAGLLNTQVDAVIHAYRAQGLRLAERRDQGDWPCLRLIKRRRYGWRRPLRASSRTSQPPGDFGSW